MKILNIEAVRLNVKFGTTSQGNILPVVTTSIRSKEEKFDFFNDVLLLRNLKEAHTEYNNRREKKLGPNFAAGRIIMHPEEREFYDRSQAWKVIQEYLLNASRRYPEITLETIKKEKDRLIDFWLRTKLITQKDVEVIKGLIEQIRPIKGYEGFLYPDDPWEDEIRRPQPKYPF
ncbi:MAG: hypothetical protein K0M45_09710 [Candidatus Paracaedibacteraceae bacterium]|nr:hypothetical protein [Candidatus Paracaedibacteraceae bacterium]